MAERRGSSERTGLERKKIARNEVKKRAGKYPEEQLPKTQGDEGKRGFRRRLRKNLQQFQAIASRWWGREKGGAKRSVEVA